MRNNWVSACYERVNNDLKRKKFFHAIDTIDLLEYIFHYPSLTTSLFKVAFNYTPLMLLPGSSVGILRILKKIAFNYKKVAEEFDYQKFMSHPTTREFLSQKHKDPESMVQIYIKMEQRHSFLFFLTEAGAKGYLGIPMERLGSLIKEEKLIPIEKVVNIDILYEKKGWWKRLKAGFSSTPHRKALAELKKMRPSYKVHNWIDASNLSILSDLNEGYANREIFFSMVTNSSVSAHVYQKVAPQIYRSPIDLFLYIKGRTEGKQIQKDDPFLREFSHNIDSLNDLSKHKMTEELIENLQDKLSIYETIEKNGKGVDSHLQMIEELLKKHFSVPLGEDYLVYDHKTLVEAIEKRERMEKAKEH